MSKILYCLLLYFLLDCVSATPIKSLSKTKIILTQAKSQSRDKRSIDLISSLEHISDTKLPRDVAPTGYRLELQPFLEEGEFQGHVTINITCQEDTDKITLHAHQDLEIPDGDVSVTYLVPEQVTTTTTTTTTTEPPVAPVPVGAARLVPVSSSFVPENACLSVTSCNSNSGNTNSLHGNGKHHKGSHDKGDEDIPEAEALASPDASKKVETHPPTLPVQSSVPVP